MKHGCALIEARHAEGVQAGLTTRVGFPASPESEDPERGRARLRRVLAERLEHPLEDFAWARQVHGTRVLSVTRAGLQGEADALITQTPGLALLLTVADCCPVLLWQDTDPWRGVAHAGWRGLVGGVLESTVEALRREGARPSELRAWIGPAIGPCCFEVGDEVAARFPPAFVRPGSGERPHVDLPAAARERLLGTGLRPDAVELSGLCTACDPERFWSYRRDGGICGRHLAYLIPS